MCVTFYSTLGHQRVKRCSSLFYCIIYFIVAGFLLITLRPCLLIKIDCVVLSLTALFFMIKGKLRKSFTESSHFTIWLAEEQMLQKGWSDFFKDFAILIFTLIFNFGYIQNCICCNILYKNIKYYNKYKVRATSKYYIKTYHYMVSLLRCVVFCAIYL